MKQIPLTQGKFALVDDEDYDRLMAMGKWCATRMYAIRATKTTIHIKKQKSIYMHRVVLNAQASKQVDHINGDKLDNRKCNLRLCNHGQNMINRGLLKNNTSGFKGVCWDKRSKKWRSYINVNCKKVHLGFFDCPIEAAQAYNAAAILHHGEFAQLNQIPQ